MASEKQQYSEKALVHVTTALEIAGIISNRALLPVQGDESNMLVMYGGTPYRISMEIQPPETVGKVTWENP